MSNKFFNILLTLCFSISIFSFMSAMVPGNEMDVDTEEIYDTSGSYDDSDIEIEDSELE